MADIPMTIRAERWNDIVILSGTSASGSAGADSSDTWTPPAGIGDLAIMEIALTASALATMVAANDLLAAWARVVNPAADVIVDIIGVTNWLEGSAALLAAYLSPDPLVLIRQGERIKVEIPELDTNAAPTGVITLHVKAVRVRPIEGPDRGPIRLVR